MKMLASSILSALLHSGRSGSPRAAPESDFDVAIEKQDSFLAMQAEVEKTSQAVKKEQVRAEVRTRILEAMKVGRCAFFSLVAHFGVIRLTTSGSFSKA